MNETTELQIQGHGLFPTPVALAELPDSGRLNTGLRTTIEARMATRPSTSHSNLGGWQSSWDLADWGGDCASEVLEQAKSMATRMTCDREGQTVVVDWRMNAWANVNGTGHGNEFHTHPGSFWSGTYYVDDGGIGEDPGLGGEFEIQDPRGGAPAMYAPRLAINAPGGLAMGSSETIPPKAGRILMFPSWLSHAVRPYTGTRQRISIAFNLSV